MYPQTIELDNSVFVEYFSQEIWPVLFPYFFWLNAIGIVIAVIMYLKYRDVVAQIKVIDDEKKSKIESLFTWVNDVPKSNPKWDRIENLSRSSNPSDWRVAIMEADALLDELLQKLGFGGDSIGERLLNMNTSNFPYLDEAWRVHKLRNILAHEASYDLQRGEMEDAIDAYNLIFKTNNFL